jgi:hypothetical protein
MTPLVVAAACLIASCQKIEEPAKVEASLRTPNAQFTDGIPLAYGQLVAVTASPDPYVGVMWFKKPDESFVVVRVNWARGQLGQKITEIPRK